MTQLEKVLYTAKIHTTHTSTGDSQMKIFVVMHRTFLALAVCAAIGVGGMTLAHHTGKGHVKVTQLSQRDIIEKLDGKDASATVVEVTFEPGQKDSPHRHAGPVFGYVLEGEYEHAIDDEPVKTYKAGETFYEPSGCCAPGGPEPERQDQDPPPGGDPAPPRRQGSDGPGEGQGVGIVGRNRSAASTPEGAP